jgi:CDP-paratose 2-epimerase
MSQWHKEGAILVTGGAGFVGSHIAIMLKRQYPSQAVVVLDNLKRRGSELNIARLKTAGVEFRHGDVRNPEDLELGNRKLALLVECSAEPSVLAGFNESPVYLINSNLHGAINCLELARKHAADFVFLSTSRVYPVARLKQLNLKESPTRFTLEQQQPMPGASAMGIAENFPLEGRRSLYGATKLAAELIALEYAEMYDLRVIINRCGVIAGPWQMGKVDQGVFTLWMAAHYFGKPLKYIGFGGSGKQIRDVLHIDDLCNLLHIQLNRISDCSSKVYNVGGGLENSLSLLETTALCREITGRQIEIKPELQERPVDIPCYISDNRRVIRETGWQPSRSVQHTLSDIFQWIRENEAALKQILS